MAKKCHNYYNHDFPWFGAAGCRTGVTTQKAVWFTSATRRIMDPAHPWKLISVQAYSKSNKIIGHYNKL